MNSSSKGLPLCARNRSNMIQKSIILLIQLRNACLMILVWILTYVWVFFDRNREDTQKRLLCEKGCFVETKHSKRVYWPLNLVSPLDATSIRNINKQIAWLRVGLFLKKILLNTSVAGGSKTKDKHECETGGARGEQTRSKPRDPANWWCHR